MLTLLRTRQGVAAIEFALLAPILLLLVLGGTELIRYLLIVQKVDKVAATVADIVTQSPSVSTAGLNEMLTAAAQVMNPYGFGISGVAILTSISQQSTGNSPGPKINWTFKGGGSLSRNSQLMVLANGTVSLPGGLVLDDKENIVVTEVYYAYKPILSGYLLGSTDIYRTVVYKPRLGALTAPPGS
ncbi:MAG: pilus assembly protein [Alphaproteobacteria bacterium]|nr:pilus assembly protein [Alphaproteobacteria bacterium]